MTKGMLSSGDVDVRQHQLNAAGVQDSRGTSYRLMEITCIEPTLSLERWMVEWIFRSFPDVTH